MPEPGVSPSHRHRTRRTRLCWLTPGLVLGLAFTSGCRIGPRNFENDNDRLRAENLALQRELEGTRLRITRYETELQHRHSPDSPPSIPVPNTVPQVSHLQFERLSGLVDTDGDGIADLLRLYLLPRDHHGRFLPVGGHLTVQLIRQRPDQPVEPLDPVHIEPDTLEKAYRSSWTGTHYRLEFSLPEAWQVAEDASSPAHLAVTATLSDALSGRNVTTHQLFPLTLRQR